MIIALVKERATFVSDFWNLTSYFFVAPTNYDEKASKKAFKEGTKEILETVKGLVDGIEDVTAENLQNTIKGWITSNEIGFGKVMMPLRLALVGALQGPDVFDIMFMIGKNESIKRIDNAIATL
jgi:glutamyl-tRNA synthetase